MGLLLSYTRAGFLETATTGAAATGPRGAMTTRTRKRRTRRKVGPTPDQQPRRSHPAVDVSGTAERAGRFFVVAFAGGGVRVGACVAVV